MTSKDFYELIVSPNFTAFHEDPGNLRLAVNTILTLDALFGITFWALKDAGQPEGEFSDDSELKDIYAAQSDDFQAFRDAAKAIKHGKLTRGDTTKLLVKSAKARRRGGRKAVIALARRLAVVFASHLDRRHRIPLDPGRSDGLTVPATPLRRKTEIRTERMPVPRGTMNEESPYPPLVPDAA